MNNPVAVIGGAGPVLGLALCNVLAAHGYRVVSLSRSEMPDLKGLDLEITHRQCDLTDGNQVFAVIRDIEENIGHISTYIHNLGDFAHAPFLESDSRQFEQLWRVNCLSAYHAAKAVIAEWIDNNGGTIVFVGATASIKGNAEFSAFASSKFALRGMAQSLAREFGPEGIHVAHVVIDGVMWGHGAESWGMKPEQCLQPGAVAGTILHLIRQDRSAWTHELDIRPDMERF
jgi:NAD(P)-dependent dehydrogenase (short-subunit alcohol dehydrogenase family)